MKPCGAALIDAVPASIRKVQAAATELGIGDIRRIVFTIPPDFQSSAKAKRAAQRGPLRTIAGAAVPRLEIKPPHALRVRGCVDHGRAVRSGQSDARRDAGRWLDLQVRDLEAGQALSYAPALAVIVASEDTEVRGDV